MHACSIYNHSSMRACAPNHSQKHAVNPMHCMENLALPDHSPRLTFPHFPSPSLTLALPACAAVRGRLMSLYCRATLLPACLSTYLYLPPTYLLPALPFTPYGVGCSARQILLHCCGGCWACKTMRTMPGRWMNARTGRRRTGGSSLVRRVMCPLAAPLWRAYAGMRSAAVGA